MTDADFLLALERCELAQCDFGHGDHVRAAYLYLREYGFAEALPRVRKAIRAYAASLGKADRYHETITVAYLALIHERMAIRDDAGSWTEFSRQHPELLDRGLLLEFYAPHELESELARRAFLLPGTRAGANARRSPST